MSDDEIVREDLILPVADTTVAVRVHRRADAHERQPAVVVMGSWLTVKEQMADLYATRLAAHGYVAVTFDFTGFGASGGGLRQTEVPVRKMRDLAAVVDLTRTWSEVDPDRIGVLGVCASAQYTLGALARGLPVAAFVSVAGWFHDTGSVAPFYGGGDGVRERLGRAAAAATAYTASGDLSLVPAYAAGDDRAGMSMEMDYYANSERGNIPAWRNEMSELSWAHWLTYDGLAPAQHVQTPTLLVHSETAVLPDNVRTVADRLGTAATVEWLDGEQTDFYDQPVQVDAAVAAAVRHLDRMGSS